MSVKSLLSADMMKWFTKSIQSEVYASHLYATLASYMQREGYFGAQKYFEKESKDELKHYQKLRDFVNDMGAVIGMPSIEAITEKPKTIGDCLDIAYEVEYDLLKQYNEFYEKAEEDDCTISTFLLDMITIQRKSIGEYGDLIARYEKGGKDECATIMFDDYLGKL